MLRVLAPISAGKYYHLPISCRILLSSTCFSLLLLRSLTHVLFILSTFPQFPFPFTSLHSLSPPPSTPLSNFPQFYFCSFHLSPGVTGTQPGRAASCERKNVHRPAWSGFSGPAAASQARDIAALRIDAGTIVQVRSGAPPIAKLSHHAEPASLPDQICSTASGRELYATHAPRMPRKVSRSKHPSAQPASGGPAARATGPCRADTVPARPSTSAPLKTRKLRISCRLTLVWPRRRAP
jgi:hypothetical protein